LIVVVFAAGSAALVLQKDGPRDRTGVDWPGAALMAGWLVAALVGISEGNAWGWGSVRQIALFVTAFVLLVAWLAAELRSNNPMIDLALMTRRPVWTANVAGLLYGYCLFTSVVLVPQLVETPPSVGYGFGASIAEAGLYLLPSTVTLMLVGPLAGWVCTTLGPRSALRLGTVASSLSLAGLTFGADASWHIYVTSMLLGAGNGLCFGALPNLIIGSAPASQTGAATGMNIVFRNIGGALGSQLATSILAASAVGLAYPTREGFRLAFLLGMAAPLLALLLTVLMPGRRTAVDLHLLPRPDVERPPTP
jgi:hypothetical protein